MCNVGGREKQAISSLRKKRGLENRTTCLLLEEKTRWIAYQGGGGIRKLYTKRGMGCRTTIYIYKVSFGETINRFEGIFFDQLWFLKICF